MGRLYILFFVSLIYVSLGCSVDINVNDTNCEINIKQGTTSIPNDSGYFNFGNIPNNNTVSIKFTIENTGDEILNLIGEEKIVVTGQNKDEFIAISYSTLSEIAAKNETSFSIIFSPKTLGKKSATVVIENNDKDANPYTFLVIGISTAPAAEIHVKTGNTDILCNTGLFDFGNTPLNTITPYVVFNIYNIGNEKLTLTGYPNRISISGKDASMFLMDDFSMDSEILNNNSTSFKLAFNPSSPGIKLAKISILNTDSDENPYTFNITGTCSANPEINLKQGSSNIQSTTGVYSFSNTLIFDSSQIIEFTIENLGSIALQLTNGSNSVKVTGSDAAMFLVINAGIKSIIPPGDSTSFKLCFTPTSPGSHNAVVEIANNDSDENPYTFKVSGICIEPEIVVKHNDENIANTTGTVSFGQCLIGDSTFFHTFTITNIDSGDLKLTGTQKIAISGADSSMFTIDENSTTATISTGNSTTFKIKFNPTSNGAKTATISIDNNDYDENPFVFTINGTGLSYIPGLAIGWLGNGSNGWQSSNGTNSSNAYNGFAYPNGICIDSNENIYVADMINDRICKWNKYGEAIGWIGGGSNGWKTTNGATDGSSLSSFDSPQGVFVDNTGNIFVADTGNNRISWWHSAGNPVSWFGGGYDGWRTSSGTIHGRNFRRFYYPKDVFVDAAGNFYIADTNNNRISKWNKNAIAIGWIGNGIDGWQKTDSNYSGQNDYRSFSSPISVVVDSSGNIYVSDTGNHRVCKWNSQGYAQGWIGGGYDGWQTSSNTNTGTGYKYFSSPRGISVPNNGYIYITGNNNSRVSKWSMSGHAVGWIGGGSNGWKTSTAPGTASDYQSFFSPHGIAVSSSGVMYISDVNNNRINKWLD